MKKLSIYIMMLLAVGVTACNEDFNKDLAAPQGYDPDAAAGEITLAATAVPSIDLSTVTDDSVVVCSFSRSDVEGASYSYKMTLNGKATLVVDAQGRAATVDVQEAIAKVYGIRPVERTMDGVLSVYAVLNGTTYTASADKIEFKATPKAPLIEGAYYINGTLTWNEKISFGNSSGDPYQNSIFTVIVPALITDENKAKDATFLIQSQSGQQIGSTEEGSDALEGILAPSTTPYPIKVAGGDYKSVKISIDMMEGTYQIEKLADAPYLWVAGNHQEWAPESAPTVFKPSGQAAYWGIVALNGGFKFTGQSYWPGGNNGGVDYGYGYFTTWEGGIADDGGNLSLPQAIYYLVVNLDKKYVSATKIDHVGLIGEALGSWDADVVDMTYDATEKCWTATADFVAGDFKIRLNRDWPNSFGGTMDAPNPFGSSNMVLDVAGNYTVKFYLNGRLVLIKNN